MANKELSIILRAIGAVQAAADIGKVGTSVRNLGSNVRGIASGAKSSILQGIGLGIGAAAYGAFNDAVGASIGFLTGSLQAAADEEAGIANLTASLKANVPAWDGTTAAIERRIEAGQSLAFSDQEQRASLALLVASTHDVNKAFDLQSVAMDLARFKHISLTDASEALVKVEAGQYRLLKSLGIELPKNATQTEALAAVERVAAGQAQAYAGTTQAAFDELGIATENLQEDIGKGLAPAAADLARGIQVYGIPAVRGLMDALGGLGDVASNILGALTAIPAAIGGIADAARFALSPLASLNDLLGSIGNSPPPPTFQGRSGGYGKTGGPPPTPSTPPTYANPTGPGHHMARGGSVSAGQEYWVGERGPERFVPSTNGTIIPNGMGSLTLNVNVSVPASDVSRGLNQRQRTVKPHGPRGSLVTA